MTWRVQGPGGWGVLACIPAPHVQQQGAPPQTKLRAAYPGVVVIPNAPQARKEKAAKDEEEKKRREEEAALDRAAKKKAEKEEKKRKRRLKKKIVEAKPHSLVHSPRTPPGPVAILMTHVLPF